MRTGDEHTESVLSIPSWLIILGSEEQNSAHSCLALSPQRAERRREKGGKCKCISNILMELPLFFSSLHQCVFIHDGCQLFRFDKFTIGAIWINRRPVHSRAALTARPECISYTDLIEFHLFRCSTGTHSVSESNNQAIFRFFLYSASLNDLRHTVRIINMLYRLHNSGQNNYHYCQVHSKAICWYVCMEIFKNIMWKNKKNLYTCPQYICEPFYNSCMNIDVDLNAAKDFVNGAEGHNITFALTCTIFL